jgi:hypothetical protein
VVPRPYMAQFVSMSTCPSHRAVFHFHAVYIFHVCFIHAYIMYNIYIYIASTSKSVSKNFVGEEQGASSGVAVSHIGKLGCDTCNGG